MRQLAFALPVPAPSLQNFVPGRNGELLHRLHRLLDGASTERFVYLWGEPGCGKSHLLAAFSAALSQTGRQVYVLPNDPGIGSGEEADYADCIVVDDVQRLTTAGQALAFRLFNTVRERDGGFVAAGSAPPSRLNLREDLLTRLGWGLCYQVQPLTDEEKAAALKSRARERGFDLPRDVVTYLLVRQRRDMSHLLAVLDGLDRYSLETKRPVTVPLARELLAAIGERS